DCDWRPSPPTKNESPSTSSRLPTMLPVIDALTSAMCPLLSATIAMISSAALPNVAFRKPPSAGPDRCASSSVPRPISPASGISDTDADRNTHGDPGIQMSSAHEIGAATSSRLIGEPRTARSTREGYTVPGRSPRRQRRSVSEPLTGTAQMTPEYVMATLDAPCGVAVPVNAMGHWPAVPVTVQSTTPEVRVPVPDPVTPTPTQVAENVMLAFVALVGVTVNTTSLQEPSTPL